MNIGVIFYELSRDNKIYFYLSLSVKCDKYFQYPVSLFWIITVTKNCNYNFSKERFPVIIFLLAALTKYNLIKLINCSYFINILMSKYIDEKMILSISDTETTSIVG